MSSNCAFYDAYKASFSSFAIQHSRGYRGGTGTLEGKCEKVQEAFLYTIGY